MRLVIRAAGSNLEYEPSFFWYYVGVLGGLRLGEIRYRTSFSTGNCFTTRTLNGLVDRQHGAGSGTDCSGDLPLGGPCVAAVVDPLFDPYLSESVTITPIT